MTLVIADKKFKSRLFLGTGKFSSVQEMGEAVKASGSELVTVALKRVSLVNSTADEMLDELNKLKVNLLPNTSGARTAKEAVFAAKLGREAFGTNWVKLEIHPDPRYLMPDPVETFLAAKELVELGFVVLPYVHADPSLCKKLEDLGVAAVMPLAAPIGSNQGLQTKGMLEIIIRESQVPVIVDAGLGAPSHAAAALELGASAVLVNTAIASSANPIEMARAFRLATEAGELAQTSGLAGQEATASASSPLTAFLG